MDIGGFQKLSMIDYPGKLSSVIFTMGCNFRCPFCHNMDLVERKLPSIPEQDILSYLEKSKDLIEGVVITGGEPTIQKDLADFIKKLKNKGLYVKLDTNGTNPSVIEKLIKEGLVDFISMDVKAPLEKDKYSSCSGVNLSENMINSIKKSIELISSSGIEHEFRTTFVPKIMDEEDVLKIAESLPKNSKYVIQQFVPQKSIRTDLKFEAPAEKDKILELVEMCKKHIKVVEARIYL